VEVDTYVPVTEPSSGKVGWSGLLQPPNNIGLALGETYTLILPGLSPAKIVITSEANPVDGSVTFEGLSEFPMASRLAQSAK